MYLPLRHTVYVRYIPRQDVAPTSWLDAGPTAKKVAAWNIHKSQLDVVPQSLYNAPFVNLEDVLSIIAPDGTFLPVTVTDRIPVVLIDRRLWYMNGGEQTKASPWWDPGYTSTEWTHNLNVVRGLPPFWPDGTEAPPVEPEEPGVVVQVYEYNPYADPANALYGQGVGTDGQWMAAGDDYNPYADSDSPYYNKGAYSGRNAFGQEMWRSWPEGLSPAGRTAYHNNMDWK